MSDPEKLIEKLKMIPHPEGGYFSESFRDKDNNVSLIYYLLKKNQNSHWHKLTKNEIDLHNFKTFSPIANTKNLLYYYRKLKDNRILFGTRGDFIGSDQSNLNRSKIMEKFLKNIFPNWSNISIDYNWRGLIAMSQKLTPSIGKIENEEIYYGFGYHGVGVSSAPWTGKQLSKLVFSSNSKDLNISKIYKGLPKKFIFPKLRIFYFRLAVLFYNIKDKLNI